MRDNPEMRHGQRAVRKNDGGNLRAERRRMGRDAPAMQKGNGKNPRSGENPSRMKPVAHREENGLSELLQEIFDQESIKQRWKTLRTRLRFFIDECVTGIFQSKEKIICGVVTFGILLFLALLQSTLFSRIRPFGSIPDLMLSFTLALSVTEGRRWGAVWGIVAAVFIESLNVSSIYLLPLLYMLTGYFGGIICRHYLTESFAVRAVLAVAVMPLKGVFTALYAVLSPLSATAGEIFFDIVLPEAASTLLLAAPVHILVYFCMKPFHHTRADMVSER